MSGSGKNLGFLFSASYGPVTGTGQIVYTDGSTQSYTLTSPDWFSTTPPPGGVVAVKSAYQNRQGDTTYNHTADIFSVAVPLDPAKTLDAVLLPAVGTLAKASTRCTFSRWPRAEPRPRLRPRGVRSCGPSLGRACRATRSAT